MRKSFNVAVIVLAVVGGVVFGQSLLSEYRAYRAQQAAVAQMYQFMVESVGTRATEDGKTAPVSRADVLADIVRQAVANAAKAQSQAQ